MKWVKTTSCRPNAGAREHHNHPPPRFTRSEITAFRYVADAWGSLMQLNFAKGRSAFTREGERNWQKALTLLGAILDDGAVSTGELYPENGPRPIYALLECY